MLTDSVGTQVLETMIISGPVGSLAKVNSSGYARNAEMLTRITSFVISANKSILTMIKMLISMVKNGFSVNIA